MRDDKMEKSGETKMHSIKERKAKETQEVRTVDWPGGSRSRKARKELSFVYNTLQLLVGGGDFSYLRYDLACTDESQCYLREAQMTSG